MKKKKMWASKLIFPMWLVNLLFYPKYQTFF